VNTLRPWLCLVFACSIACADEVRVNENGHIEAKGSDVRVFRGDAKTPLFGSVTTDHDTVRFAPCVPFISGEFYRIEFRKSDGTWSALRLRLDMPKTAPPTLSIAPKPAMVPANAVKLYLHFTQPMEQGVFLERITLRREDGSPVQGPFRETELWSPDGKRLTLWLHPGRQKTGVNLNTDEGPVLREGERHTLKIDRTWRSTAGVPLGRDVVFSITAVAPDHTCPDPLRWQITAPKAGTREPLSITFDEPLDPAMLTSALSVKRDQVPVIGAVNVAADARSWSFTPSAEWSAASYLLEIDPLLEDLAGNNLQHPFEVDRDQPVKPVPWTTVLRFEVR
jgi:hypothetical protein